MEKFSLTLPSASLPQSVDSSTVCGVVSSGNLEILVEPAATPGACQFMVNTSAHGFRDIWEAVLNDFVRRHNVGGLSFSINDAGATPAVVSLRLDQAFEVCGGDVA